MLMHTSGTIIFLLTAGIIGIKVLWVATEPRPWKERFGKDMIISNLLELIILELQIISALFFPFPSFGLHNFLLVFGIALYSIGMILALWARLLMKHSWGFPTESVKRQNFLATGGPFGVSRNPIYVGFIMIYFGYALALRSWFILLYLPMIWYFYKSILQEEVNLEKKYGKEYVDYKKRVPRFLLLKTG